MGNGNHKVNYSLKNFGTELLNATNTLSEKISEAIEARKPKHNQFLFEEREGYSFKDYYQPSLYDLLKYFESKDIVGEQSVSALSTLAFTGGHSVIVQGPSGSGKSLIQEALLELIPENFVYKLGLTTLAALSRDAEKINESKALYVGEFQKAISNKDLREVFKDISNGDSFKRTITSSKGEVQNLEIRGDLSLHTALAEENCFNSVFDNQAEVYRRFIHLYTRINGDVTAEVIAKKAKMDSDPFYFEKIREFDNVEALSDHLTAVMVNQDLKVINPFAEYIAEKIVYLGGMSAALVDHQRNLIRDHTIFHAQKRIPINSKVDQYLFCNIEDVKNVVDLYQKHFLKSINHIDPQANNDYNSDINWKECLDAGMQIIQDKYTHLYSSWLDNQRNSYIPYSLNIDEDIKLYLQSDACENEVQKWDVKNLR